MRKAVIAVGLVLAFLLAAFFASRLGVSYYRRWQASRLLAIVRQLHPGSTTEAEARSALKPFARYYEGPVANGIGYEFQNSPPLPWTRFSVELEFLDGLVAEVHLTEMQVERAGYPHPNSASVTIYSNRVRPLPADFKGYREASWKTGGVDSEGNWTGFTCCHARSIKLDERATSAQLERLLNMANHLKQ